MLQALGFPLTFLSARVWTGTGWGPDKDHMALRVDAGSGSWLADVGFGESFVLPLRLEPGLAQDRGLTPFRVVHDGAIWIMEAGDASGDWTPRYRFTLDAHAPHSFAAMCMYQQTSPETTFTRRVVCSRAMGGGRVSVTHDRVIVTSGGLREESPLADAPALREALATHQGIDLTLEECETIVRRFS